MCHSFCWLIVDRSGKTDCLWTVISREQNKTPVKTEALFRVFCIFNTHDSGGGCRIRPALRSRPPRVAACPRHAAKCPRVRILFFFETFGGGCRIRTRVGFRPNGFQDRPVMTASVTLRMSCGL